MDYAIVKSGSTKFLTVIKLRDWDSWEWNDFATVKSFEDGEIVWFSEEKEAIEFMFEHFDKDLIDPKYSNDFSLTREYYID